MFGCRAIDASMRVGAEERPCRRHASQAADPAAAVNEPDPMPVASLET
jgi:hypothetical protein